ncbi:copper resistance CopC/CopD family protein [Microvirga sp. G4-2]|uniref:copper resistance CopC/CopD family protein n=1 Tax=Microvirga sp. G4-2 TaxID=3434467 RepID=UPI004044ABE4
MRMLVTIIWFALAVLYGERASAHAALVSSNPADGAVVETAPSNVELRFNEPIAPLMANLADAQGHVHRELPVAGHDTLLDIRLPADLPAGSHVLSYRVVSGDGHPISGSVVFSIGTSTTVKTGSEAGQSWDVHVALWLSRMLIYLGLFAGVGGVFFQRWIAPTLPSRKTARILTILLVVGTGAALASLAFQGLDALGLSLPDLGSSLIWSAGWQTSFGPTITAALTAFALASAGKRVRAEPWGRGLSLMALIGVGMSIALSGHASSAPPQWLTRPAVFLHSIGVAYWVGALIPLMQLLRQVPPLLALPVVRRFSSGALVAVGIMSLAGLVLAVVQVAAPANLIGTAYGRILIAKTLLVAGLLGLAGMNRLWLTPALASPEGSGRKWLIRSIAAEIVLVAAILALAGLWRFTPPPRVLASAPEISSSTSVHLHASKLMAQVTLFPGHRAATRATITVASMHGETMNPKEISLILAKPDSGIEPIERSAVKAGRNEWSVDGLVLPLSGTWQIKVEVLVNDFEKASLEGLITIKP